MMTTLDELYTTSMGNESVVVEFAFAGELTVITAATVAISPINGVDTGAAAMLDGLPQVRGTSVYQRVRPGIAGLNYQIVCRATQGETAIIRQAILPVRDA